MYKEQYLYEVFLDHIIHKNIKQLLHFLMYGYS